MRFYPMQGPISRSYLWFCGPNEFCLRFEQVHRQRCVRLSLSRQKLDFFPSRRPISPVPIILLLSQKRTSSTPFPFSAAADLPPWLSPLSLSMCQGPFRKSLGRGLAFRLAIRPARGRAPMGKPAEIARSLHHSLIPCGSEVLSRQNRYFLLSGLPVLLSELIGLR